MRCLPGSSSLFRNKFNKLHNVRLYLTYNTKLIYNRDFGVKTLGFCHYNIICCITIQNCKPLVVY